MRASSTSPQQGLAPTSSRTAGAARTRRCLPGGIGEPLVACPLRNIAGFAPEGPDGGGDPRAPALGQSRAQCPDRPLGPGCDRPAGLSQRGQQRDRVKLAHQSIPRAHRRDHVKIMSRATTLVAPCPVEAREGVVRLEKGPSLRGGQLRIGADRLAYRRLRRLVGEFIRQQRELAAIPLRQFATLAGISNPYLFQIERGLRMRPPTCWKHQGHPRTGHRPVARDRRPGRGH